MAINRKTVTGTLAMPQESKTVTQRHKVSKRWENGTDRREQRGVARHLQSAENAVSAESGKARWPVVARCSSFDAARKPASTCLLPLLLPAA